MTHSVGRGWVRAWELRAHDWLKTLRAEELEALQVRRVELEQPVRVYNVTVTSSHTYYVGKRQVLVHNKLW